MAQGTGGRREALFFTDPREAASALLRGVEVGLDAAGRPRVRVDPDLTDDELRAIVEALPGVVRRLAAETGGQQAEH